MFTTLSQNYSKSKASTSAVFASITQSVFGLHSWAGLPNVAINDNVPATTTSDTGVAPITEYIFCQNTGILIPDSANILGFIATVKRKYGTSSSNPTNSAGIALIKQGGGGTAEKVDSFPLLTSYTIPSYGGQADLWGAAWTPADINGANFGLQYRISFSGDTPAFSANFFVDFIGLTVYYEV